MLCINWRYDDRANWYTEVYDRCHFGQRSYLDHTWPDRRFTETGDRTEEHKKEEKQMNRIPELQFRTRCLKHRIEQPEWHNAVKNSNKNSNYYWKEKLTITEEYDAYSKECISLFKQLESRCDCHYWTKKAVKHQVVLGRPNKRPTPHAPYRAEPNAREFENQDIVQMITMDVNQSAQTKWASSTAPITKNDCTFCFCIDCQTLVTLKCKDSYVTLCMDHFIDSPGGTTILLNLDPKSRYWQVEIFYEDRKKTAFTYCHALSHFTKMLSGSNKGPGMFQRVKWALLSEGKWQFVLDYFKDIDMLSRFTGEHTDHVWQAVALMIENWLALRLKKCNIFPDCIDDHTHVPYPGRLEISTRKVYTTSRLQKLTKCDSTLALIICTTFYVVLWWIFSM